MAQPPNTDTLLPKLSPTFASSAVNLIRGNFLKHYWGLREGLSVSLSVGLIVGQNMVGIGGVRGAEIFT